MKEAVNGECIYLSLTTVGIDGTKSSSLSYVKLVFLRYLRSILKDAGTEIVSFLSEAVVQNTGRIRDRRGGCVCDLRHSKYEIASSDEDLKEAEPYEIQYLT